MFGNEYQAKKFQSTPSVGRATTIDIITTAIEKVFQSTPSVGRATKHEINITGQKRISIHALRGEGDKKAVVHHIVH